jgi:hypothetical protein
VKYLLYLTVISLTTFCACSKSEPIVTLYDKNSTGTWQLVQKNWGLGATDGILTPAKDSVVLLELNTDNTYISKLNGNPVSQGSYSITIDTSYYNTQTLKLNNFTTTGIFALFIIIELDTNGQVKSTFDGLYMNISRDTLRLSSPPTPGGFSSYIFVRK